VKEKALAADELAQKTYIWLAMFSVAGTLLAMLVMFFIFRYVRKTQESQNALENSLEETEKLTKTKELFMANMSHEIRTPVTAISGFTEQLLQEPMSESTNRSLRIIKSSSDHLANIINDILDFSKLQNGKLVLENVHFGIGQILEDVYLLFERQAQRNNTRLSYTIAPDTPHVLLGDPYRLKQIIINLVSNAVKFTNDGKVHFTVKPVFKQKGEIDLELECVDNGIGIDESKIKFIFDDFTQEEMSTTRKYGGTGLGLSIVKKLVELYKGTIDCVSRKNHGTRITCHLPFLTGDEKLVKSDIKSKLYIPDEVKNLRILIVDDEEYNRMLFKVILNRWKVAYREAVNGIEAIEILKSDRFDLLFMDVRMPGMDGLRATQIIREEMKIPEKKMAVICISAASLDEDFQKYRKAGVNGFLPKPFTEEMLLTKILSIIKNYEPVAEIDNFTGEKFKPDDSAKIDLRKLYHISGGDEKFVKQMLIEFLESTSKGLKEMQDSLLSGSRDQIAELAHKMFPPCHHLGAVDMCSLIKKIEGAVRNNTDLMSVEILINASIKEFETISAILNERISKIT
jgi:signal transduction histidine kinase/CheY-like chemotaxis protein/HPt (histidine-containing phosphotransfer) domain-containing protein